MQLLKKCIIDREDGAQGFGVKKHHQLLSLCNHHKGLEAICDPT